MSKVAHYLQEHLVGEVMVGEDIRKHFMHDASVLEIMPAIVVYPRSENDVRKTARFAWQLAERGRVFPITARGEGSNTVGAALGEGIVLSMPAHMNKILSLDQKKEIVEVEAGINYDKLQQALFTHGFFLPAYPSSLQYSTIGGAVANNASGEKSLKYGSTAHSVEGLRMVLSNGEVIETSRLSKRELSKKMGQSSFEGEIYRSLDALIEENKDVINRTKERIKAKRNAAGYNIFDVKRKDGSFDLTPLICGSQGTLGIVTEVLLKLTPHNPVTSLVVISLPTLEHLATTLPKIMELKPSSCEMINGAALQQVAAINPNQLVGVAQNLAAAVTLFVEFDDPKDSAQKKNAKKLQKIVDKLEGSVAIYTELEDQEKAWKIRQAVATLLTQQQGQAKSVPIAEDVAIPVESLAFFLQKTQNIYTQNGLTAAFWGHAGDGVVRMQPVLDLQQLGDRQRLFRLSDEIYQTVIEMGGSISAAHGDGRMRTPYLQQMYGEEVCEVFAKIKAIFDPLGTLNPGIKIGTNLDDIKGLLRESYDLGHRITHLPRS